MWIPVQQFRTPLTQARRAILTRFINHHGESARRDTEQDIIEIGSIKRSDDEVRCICGFRKWKFASGQISVKLERERSRVIACEAQLRNRQFRRMQVARLSPRIEKVQQRNIRS